MKPRLVAAAMLAASVASVGPALAQTQDAGSAPLTIVAELKAKPGKEKELRQALQSLIAPTRQQQGNINYDMLVSNQDPGVIIFYENWRTKAEWDRHMKSSILVDFAKKQPELAQSWKLYQMTRLP